MWGQTAEKVQASRRTRVSQVPFTLLVGGNQGRTCAVQARAVHRSKQHPQMDRSSVHERLSEVTMSPDIIRLCKRQSQTSVPPTTCSEHFFCALSSMLFISNHALCAQRLSAHILTIDSIRQSCRRIHETRTLHNVSGSDRQDELEWLSGFWFREPSMRRRNQQVSNEILHGTPGDSRPANDGRNINQFSQIVYVELFRA